MTPARWARIKEIFGDAMDVPQEQRPAFLDRSCGPDTALRQEIEALLHAEKDTLESPVPGVLSQATDPDLSRGEMLGHYRVETRIGRGGMGVVYRAYDTRLDRRVALKILRPEQLADPERKQRLIREARAASALMHPNIVAVHDIGSDREIDFIAMEYVEGRPLEQVIPEGGLTVRQVIAYAIQVAAALAGAHSSGVIHQDLKPGNIMITREGLVKLLDFGLARRTRRRETDNRTQTLETEIAGTPSYMSPEQIRGDAVDTRSDIFSFGAVLFRMTTGRDAFDGGSAVATMNAILANEPANLSDGNRVIPFALESIILHCLEKAPDERFQSAKDLAFALEAIAGPLGGIQTPVDTSRKISRDPAWIATIAAVAFLAVLAAYFWFAARRTTPSVNGRTYAQITDEAGAELFPSLAADGKSVVYASKASGNWDIYLRRIGSRQSVNLTKDSADDDTQPAFSPDGKQIAYRSDRDGGGIFVMRPDGSRVKRLADAGYNPSWSPDGTQVVYAEESVARPEDRSGRSSHLWTVDIASGRKRQLTKEDGVQPQWSPNGRHIAYWSIDLDGDRDIWTVAADGGQPVRITKDAFLDWDPVWSADGMFIYFCSNRGGSMGIWRVPIKESSGEAEGAPEPVRAPGSYPAHLSFSRDGSRLAYVQQATTGSLRTVRFDPVRPAILSEPKEIIRSADGVSRPALSPDGQWLAYNTTEQDESLFVVGVDGNGLRRLTNSGHRNRGPRWSPDGKRIAFFSQRSGDWEIWTADVNTGELRQITNLAGQNVAWPVWSTDGKQLAYTVFGVNTFFLDPSKSWEQQTIERVPPFPEGQLFNGWSWSPDGRTLAGFLNNNNGIAVYSLGTRAFRKLTDFGSDPVWLSDSRRLLFHHKGKIQMVDSENGSVRELLSIAPDEVARRGFAVSSDDRHIYFSVSTTEADVWMVEFSR
ncbi:MAG TPA: protein kinase [Bryobacteraceae bacterium]|nr:protein kinase [Bryobacteraceae bacterium]